MSPAPATERAATPRRRGDFLARNPFPRPWTLGFFYREKMRAIHQVVPDESLPDVLEVVAQELVDEALVLTDGRVTSGPSDVDLPPPGEPYATPTLTRYTDMGDVLALDPPLPELGAIRGDKS